MGLLVLDYEHNQVIFSYPEFRKLVYNGSSIDVIEVLLKRILKGIDKIQSLDRLAC